MISIDIMILVIFIAAILFGFLVFTQPKDDEAIQYLWDEQITGEKVVFRNGNQVVTYQMLREGREEVDIDAIGREDALEIAQHFYEKGLEAKERGTNDKAIDLFQQVHQISPKWPAPLYELAMLYLTKSEYQFAYEAFEDIDILYPRGFKDTKVALFSLQLEQEGIIPIGTFLRFKAVLKQPAVERKEALTHLLEEVSRYSPAIFQLIKLTKDRDTRLRLIKQGLELNSDKETYQHLLIEKAILDTEEGEEYEAIHTLGTLILNADTTSSAEIRAKQMLSEMTANEKENWLG